jgi:hypothetical protein
MIEAFISTDFEGGRHQNRVNNNLSKNLLLRSFIITLSSVFHRLIFLLTELKFDSLKFQSENIDKPIRFEKKQVKPKLP